MGMNIYARRGQKVRFVHPNAGYLPDREKAKKHLVVGAVYTVKKTIVHDWDTEVHLMEISGEHFNSVMFDDVS